MNELNFFVLKNYLNYSKKIRNNFSNLYLLAKMNIKVFNGIKITLKFKLKDNYCLKK